MEIPLRTAYGQAGRCGMQPKPSSLRAQAHQKVGKPIDEKSACVEAGTTIFQLYYLRRGDISGINVLLDTSYVRATREPEKKKR
ncbi:hypothetical protein TNCV_1334851 [Trichonephila clavipes]|nr:hypothetical protein TNCV_1334851 [Trichonephila clavipes]